MRRLPGTLRPFPPPPPPPALPGRPRSPRGSTAPAGGPMGRHGLVVVVALLLVAALAGGFALTRGGGDQPQAPASSAPAAPGPAGELQIVEQGGAAYANRLRGNDQYGWAVVVANTSDQTATAVTLDIDFVDPSGEVVETAQEVLQVVPAGTEVGLGGSVDRPNVEHLQVTGITAGAWAPADGYGHITATDVSVTMDDLGLPTVAFRAESTYGTPITGPSMRVVFRNAGGELIGGASSRSSGRIEAGGQFEGSVEGDDSFIGIDPSKTEVYVDPGF